MSSNGSNLVWLTAIALNVIGVALYSYAAIASLFLPGGRLDLPALLGVLGIFCIPASAVAALWIHRPRPKTAQSN
jgi:hypothetical protein